eukprot:GHVU01127209.1.p1 GENE.GHVU01127209.1~~GHVU01127209.1.p1  ORF type:complete len:147 (-),score=14.58 GHVU01127209.1:4-444(-)
MHVHEYRLRQSTEGGLKKPQRSGEPGIIDGRVGHTHCCGCHLGPRVEFGGALCNSSDSWEGNWTHTGGDTTDESQVTPDDATWGNDVNNANDGRSNVECKSDCNIYPQHTTAPPSLLHSSFPSFLHISLLPFEAGVLVPAAASIIA